MMGSYKNDHKLISFFGRVNYDWKERYLFTFLYATKGLPALARIINGAISRLYLSVGVSRMRSL